MNLRPPDIDRWVRHFERNRGNRPEPAWDVPCEIPARAFPHLVRSLQQFQLGDGGGPARLIGWDANVRLAADPVGHRLIAAWFAEEREHARLLDGLLRRFGAPAIRSHWSFRTFCAVRRFGGAATELHILLLTEIASTAYYRLLARHVPDPVVRQVCRLILRDEAGHIAFHRSRLAGRPPRSSGARYGLPWRMAFTTAGLAAATMLWINHRRALRAFGASDDEFYWEVLQELGRFLHRLRREHTGDQPRVSLPVGHSWATPG